MKKRNLKFLLTFLCVLFFALNYSFLDKALVNFLDDSEVIKIDSVIDGDTVVSNGTSIRLLGVNSPEKGKPYYEEAKLFLENRILGKKVKLEFGSDKYDKYDRILAYIYLDNVNVNFEIVENGFANCYFYEKGLNYYKCQEVWKMCVDLDLNFCKKSKHKCSDCIKIIEFDDKTEISKFLNKCNFECDLTGWTIKDEGRKIFKFPDFKIDSGLEFSVIVGSGVSDNKKLYWERKDYVWTSTGDTLFLRDNLGGLVLWESY